MNGSLEQLVIMLLLTTVGRKYRVIHPLMPITGGTSVQLGTIIHS